MGASGTDIASTETPAPSRRPKLSVTVPADPGFAALRRAARAAIVIPPVLAFNTLVLHGGQNVIFAVFGCFALLVMSDFGGQRAARALAYLTAAVVGALLVAIGTLASAFAGLEHFPVAGLHTPAAWHESAGVQTTGVAPHQCGQFVIDARDRVGRSFTIRILDKFQRRIYHASSNACSLNRPE